MVNIQHETLRRRLLEMRKRLLHELEQLRILNQSLGEGGSGNSGGYSDHMADDASETFELEKNLALEHNLRSQLEEVEHALQKFARGNYGLCDDCGQPISPERLEVRPHANLCITCRTRREREVRNGHSHF